MLKDKRGFMLIESILLLEIVMVLVFVLVSSLRVFHSEYKFVHYANGSEDELMRKAYE